MNHSLLKLQIGPVQDFIAQARSTRDLWSGSYLLSWLMAAGARALVEELSRWQDQGPAQARRQVISPNLVDQPLLDLHLAGPPAACGTSPINDERLTPNFTNILIAELPSDAKEATRIAAAVATAIRALVGVLGHLGSLGTRGRQAMGALAFTSCDFLLKDCLRQFTAPDNLDIRDLKPSGYNSCAAAVGELAHWLRSWRLHGQMHQTWIKTGDNRGYWRNISSDEQNKNRDNPGFPFARRDHNEGLDVQGTGAVNPDPESPAGVPGSTFRPALGLPIVQFFSSLEGHDGKQLKRKLATVEWSASAEGGRFASPVLLRPYRDGIGWRSLVLFVDSHQWNYRRPVHLSCNAKGIQKTRTVLPGLYREMKLNLATFPPPTIESP